MPHPPYSPDLPPIYFFVVVSQLQIILKGKCFANVEEVKQKTAEVLKGVKINKLKKCLEQWKKCLVGLIASHGEYFEGH